MSSSDQILPIQAVEEYQKLYQQNFGVMLSLEEARPMAERFLRFVNLVEKHPTIKTELPEN